MYVDDDILTNQLILITYQLISSHDTKFKTETSAINAQHYHDVLDNIRQPPQLWADSRNFQILKIA